ncbi:RICIN domain-containing protein [Roseateles sp. MS654]|uniref:RICIN domain-containing protein n=1 Tax=Roseateles sp. MS654 TaxID=3412685 RepID=UPI003C2FF014
MYQVIVSARERVDIFSLDAADGRFAMMLQNAMLELDRKNAPITVRFLFGDYPDPTVNYEARLQIRVHAFVEQVLSRLPGDRRRTSKLKILAGYYWMNPSTGSRDVSWNHSKIISADGKRAIVGGHNLFSEHYLDRAPVHDISVHVGGRAAEAAEAFATNLLSAVCTEPRPPSLHRSVLEWSAPGQFVEACPGVRQADFRPDLMEDPSARGRVFAVGRWAVLARGASTGTTGDRAQIAMINAAKSSIRMSIQDLGPFKVTGMPLGGWPDEVLNALASALSRGVHVYIVRSSYNATAGGLDWKKAMYEYDHPSWEDINMIYERLRRKVSDDNAQRMTCQFLHFAPLRMSEEQFWDSPSTLPGPIPFANHAKFLMVDDLAFYVGSQNLYVSNNAEFGFVFDDAETTRKILSEYYKPLWDWSKWSATSKAGVDINCKTRVVDLHGKPEAASKPLQWAIDSRLNWARVTLEPNDSVQVSTRRDGETAQRWLFPGDGTVRSAGSGKCLSLQGGSKDDGAVVVAKTCVDSQMDQRWDFTPSGNIRNRHSGKCLDLAAAEGGLHRNLGQLIQFRCHEGANQRWSLRTAQGAPRVKLVANGSSTLMLRSEGKFGSPGPWTAEFTVEPSGRLRVAPLTAEDQGLQCLHPPFNNEYLGPDCRKAGANPTAWMGFDGHLNLNNQRCATLEPLGTGHLLAAGSCNNAASWRLEP